MEFPSKFLLNLYWTLIFIEIQDFKDIVASITDIYRYAKPYNGMLMLLLLAYRV